MSFEDDMIEYGFWDGNDYLDYLIDEADRYCEEQNEYWSECDRCSDYNSDLVCADTLIDYGYKDIDELFFEGYEKEEELEKQSIKTTGTIYDWIMKLWEKDNPQKAKLWKYYYKNNESITIGLERDKYKKCIYTYNVWKTWLEKFEDYEEFKIKSPKEWNVLKNNIKLNYIIEATKKYLGLGYEFKNKVFDYNTFATYKKLIIWIRANKKLFYNEILSKYDSKIDKQQMDITNAWEETFKWYDAYAVWKMKNPDLWYIEKKEWDNINPIDEWKTQNDAIWKNWLKVHSVEWNNYYKSQKELLWYIYTEVKWKNAQINKDLSFGQSDEYTPNNIINDKKDIDDEEFRSILISKYHAEIAKNKNKATFIQKNCNESDMIYLYTFWNFFNLNVIQNIEETDYFQYELPEDYANRKIIELWANTYPKEWKKWKYDYLKSNIRDGRYCNLEQDDYFNTWKKLYPRKWAKWEKKGYKLWAECKKQIEVWLSWFYDGNILAFNEWAKENIIEWDETIFYVMSEERHLAYESANYEMKLFIDENLSEYVKLAKEDCESGVDSMLLYEMNYWIGYNVDNWNFWRDCINNIIIRKEWENKYRFLERNYQQTYRTDIKIKELMYLDQIGYKNYQEGLAIIEIDNKYGFFNEKYEIVVPIIYDKVKVFHNGYAPVCIMEKDICSDYDKECLKEKELWGIVDKKGNRIIPIIYDNIRQITESFVVFEKDFHCGIIELSTGNEVIPPIYDNIKILDNGMWTACYAANNVYKWALISGSGNITPFQYSYIFNSAEEYAMIVKNAIISDNNNGYLWGEWGYIDKEGNELEELREFDSPYSFDKYWIDNH